MSRCPACYTGLSMSLALMNACFYNFHGSKTSLDATTKRVPICTPFAPSMNAAAMPLPSAIPPAAITGICHGVHDLRDQHHCGKLSDMPACLTCLPPRPHLRRSVPYALPSATDATTGMTLTPGCFPRLPCISQGFRLLS